MLLRDLARVPILFDEVLELIKDHLLKLHLFVFAFKSFLKVSLLARSYLICIQSHDVVIRCYVSWKVPVLVRLSIALIARSLGVSLCILTTDVYSPVTIDIKDKSHKRYLHV